MTHIQSRRNAAAACMLEIMHILKWDWEKYCFFKYKCGLNYLSLLIGSDSYIKDQLEQSKMFWQWWKVHWTLREEAFLSDLSGEERSGNISVARLIYEELHNPAELVNGICQFRVDLENDYAKMINEIHHEHG